MVWGGGCVALLGNIGEGEAHMCSLTTTAGSGRRNWSPSAQLLSADPQTGSWNIGREFRVENWCRYGFQPFTLSPWSSLPPSPDQWVFLTRQKNKNIAIEGDYGQWCGESGSGEGCKMVPIISGGNWNHVKVQIIKTTMLMKRHLWVCLQQRVLEHNEPAPFFFQTAVWRSPHRFHHCSAKIFFLLFMTYHQISDQRLIPANPLRAKTMVRNMFSEETLLNFICIQNLHQCVSQAGAFKESLGVIVATALALDFMVQCVKLVSFIHIKKSDKPKLKRH